MRLLTCLLAVVPALALAQVDLVDPDAPTAQPVEQPKKKKPAVAPESDEGDGTLVAPPTVKKEPVKKAAPPPAEPKAAPELPKKKEAPPVVVRTISDADLRALWNKWANANASKNAAAELAARKELLETRNLIAST